VTEYSTRAHIQHNKCKN